MKTKSAILLLGGSSSRFNQEKNKVYFEINNKPLFLYSLEVLKEFDFEKIVIVYNKLDLEILNSSLEKYNYKNIYKVVGGNTRVESCLNGLKLIDSYYTLVHDGARPNINKDLVEKLLNEESECVSLGVSVVDTIKKVTSKVETLDRSNLFMIQTPQVTNTLLLKNCLEKSQNDKLITDDLSSIEKYSNYNPRIIEGYKLNFKITTYEDYKLMKFLIENKYV